MKNTVRLWARVDPKDVRDIQRAQPKWGWRTALISFVFSYLAERLRAGERPSMETMRQYGKEAVDIFVDNNELKL
jgi:hypothetical protein